MEVISVVGLKAIFSDSFGSMPHRFYISENGKGPVVIDEYGFSDVKNLIHYSIYPDRQFFLLSIHNQEGKNPQLIKFHNIYTIMAGFNQLSAVNFMIKRIVVNLAKSDAEDPKIKRLKDALRNALAA
jgi:hypothetical protein